MTGGTTALTGLFRTYTGKAFPSWEGVKLTARLYATIPRDVNTYLFTPERESVTDQSSDTTQVAPGEPGNLLDHLQKREGPKGSCTGKAHPSAGGDSREVEPWSSLNKMEAAPQL